MRSFESAMLIGTYEPATAAILVGTILTTAAAVGGTVYQATQKPPDLPEVPALETTPVAPVAPPPPQVQPQATPPAPTPGSSEAVSAAEAAAAEEVDRQRRRLGRQQTVLTSPLGAAAGGLFFGA